MSAVHQFIIVKEITRHDNTVQQWWCCFTTSVVIKIASYMQQLHTTELWACDLCIHSAWCWLFKTIAINSCIYMHIPPIGFVCMSSLYMLNVLPIFWVGAISVFLVKNNKKLYDVMPPFGKIKCLYLQVFILIHLTCINGLDIPQQKIFMSWFSSPNGASS